MRLKDDEQKALVEIASGVDAMAGVSTSHAFAILRKLMKNDLIDESLGLTRRGQHVVAKLTKKNALTPSESKTDGTAIQGHDGPGVDDPIDGSSDSQSEEIILDRPIELIVGPASVATEQSDDADRGDAISLPDAD